MTNIKPGMTITRIENEGGPFKVLSVEGDLLWLTNLADDSGMAFSAEADGFEQTPESKDEWSKTTRRALALREIADFMEAHPEVPVSHVTVYMTPARVDFFPNDEAEMRTIVKALGNVEKVKGMRGVMFRKTTDFVAYECESANGVCTQVVVGKETKTVRKVVTEAVYEDVEEEVDILEWECPESALSPEA